MGLEHASGNGQKIVVRDKAQHCAANTGEGWLNDSGLNSLEGSVESYESR